MKPPGDSYRETINRALSEACDGHTLRHWWSRPRFWWGGLSADELAELGCWDTLLREAQELIAFRNRSTGRPCATWFVGDVLV